MRPLRLLPLAFLSLVSLLRAAGNAAPSPKADSVLQLLTAGNQRFVSGHLIHPDQSLERRAELTKGQKPFAVVLTCADSRVAPEIYFDQGLGDLFVLRNAGNILDEHTLGSIEYAVEHLGTPLVIVVGHEKCGAVAATIAGGHAPGHIGSIVHAIAPHIAACKGQPGDELANSVRANALAVARELPRLSEILGQAVDKGHLTIVAAHYGLASGKVELLDAPAAPAAAPEPPAAPHSPHAPAGH